MKHQRAASTCAAIALLAVSFNSVAAHATFDFENQPIVTETPFTLTDAGLSASFAGPSDIDPGAFSIASNFPTSTGYQYRLMSGDFLTIGSAFGASGASLSITFSAPVSSFSVDFGLDDPTNVSALSFTTNTGGSGTGAGSLTPGFLYPEATLAYSGPAFSSIVFQSTAIDFQLDNLRVTTAVPEPTTGALLGIGLAAVALVRRRARRT